MSASVIRTGRAAPGRVAAVHDQTRSGLGITGAFVVAAVITAVNDVSGHWWLPLHLFVVGGLLSAISAVTQMLAVTWAGAPAPHPVVAAGQRWLLAAAAIALVVGHETERAWLFVAGGAGVITAMIGLVAILLTVRRRAVNARFAPAIEAYVAAVCAGVAGMSVGVFLGVDRVGSRFVELRDLHLVLNVFGLVGLVIAGTLPFFAATQLRTRMSQRATVATMRLAFLGLAASTIVASIGAMVRPGAGLQAAGLVAYAVGLAVVVALCPVPSARQLRWAGPRGVQLAAGLLWWIAMTFALAFARLGGTVDRMILRTIVIGGFAQILVASLAYLGPVLRGGGHQRLTSGFAITRSWVSLVVGNVAAVAMLAEHRTAAGVALAVWAVDVVVRAVRLVVPAGESGG